MNPSTPLQPGRLSWPEYSCWADREAGADEIRPLQHSLALSIAGWGEGRKTRGLMLPIRLVLPEVGIVRGFGDLGALVSSHNLSCNSRICQVRGADAQLLPGVVLEGEPNLRVLDMVKTLEHPLQAVELSEQSAFCFHSLLPPPTL